MRAKGFGDQYVRRYRMVTAFHMQRRPLIVFICGTACTGMRLALLLPLCDYDTSQLRIFLSTMHRRQEHAGAAAGGSAQPAQRPADGRHLPGACSLLVSGTLVHADCLE